MGRGIQKFVVVWIVLKKQGRDNKLLNVMFEKCEKDCTKYRIQCHIMFCVIVVTYFLMKYGHPKLLLVHPLS